MKKLFLLGAGALLCAQGMFAIDPQIYTNAQFTTLAPDGSIAASFLYGNAAFVNAKTGEILGTYAATEDGLTSYSEPVGNGISNTGIVLGSTSGNSNACMWKAGEWSELQTPNPQLSNLTNGITPDGLTICGSVGMAKISLEDAAVPMLVPAVWNLQSDGTYGEPVLLPHPDKDFTGRVPQYITAVNISKDGKTILGQVVDYSGILPTPIVYTKNDDGEWSYKLLGEKLINPNNLVFPEFPGDGPAKPSQEQFMTEEELAAYQAAYDAWYENAMNTGNWDNMPSYEDFMTEEEIASYNAAVAAWQVQYDEWLAKYNAFDNVWNQVIGSAVIMVFNTVSMTPDGKKYMFARQVEVEDPESWFGTVAKISPIVFTEGVEEPVMYDYNDNVSPTMILADGSVIGTVTDEATQVQRAKIYVKDATTPTNLDDYIATQNPDLYQWMKTNMCHDIDMYDFENDEFVTMEDVWVTGVPYATPDGLMFVTTALNVFDMENEEAFTFGYVLPLSDNVLVKDIRDSEFSVKAERGGRVVLAGDVAEVHVYDAQGRVVYSTSSVSNVIETGLRGGAYIVKAVSANGAEKIVKAIF